MQISSVLDMLNQGDLFPLLLLIALVTFVGERAVRQTETLKFWGWRIAGVAFATYCIYSLSTIGPSNAQECLWVVFRGLLAGGLALGTAWIFLAILHVIWECIVVAPLQRIRAHFSSVRHRRARQIDYHGRTEQGRARAHDEADRRAREQKHAKDKADAARRRADAKASVELEYTRLATQLGNSFTREMLREYVDAYLSEEHPPEDVERRGKDLIAYLEAQVDQTKQRDSTSLNDLDAWHQAEEQRIESSPADDRLKRRLLAALNVRYAELAAKLMEELEP